MTTFRVAHRARFTAVDRATINDERLSFRARGVLVWLLDKPDDWRCSATAIARAGGEGREAIRTALRELEAFGYLRRERTQDGSGRWSTVVTVYERPPQPGDASVDNRATEVGFLGVGFPGVGFLGANTEHSHRGLTPTAALDARDTHDPAGSDVSAEVGTRALIETWPATSKPNRYDAVCVYCHRDVAAGSGRILRYQPGDPQRVACSPGDASCRQRFIESGA